jgi:hypothetical protein
MQRIPDNFELGRINPTNAALFVFLISEEYDLMVRI